MLKKLKFELICPICSSTWWSFVEVSFGKHYLIAEDQKCWRCHDVIAHFTGNVLPYATYAVQQFTLAPIWDDDSG